MRLFGAGGIGPTASAAPLSLSLSLSVLSGPSLFLSVSLSLFLSFSLLSVSPSLCISLSPALSLSPSLSLCFLFRFHADVSELRLGGFEFGAWYVAHVPKHRKKLTVSRNHLAVFRVVLMSTTLFHIDAYIR